MAKEVLEYLGSSLREISLNIIEVEETTVEQEDKLAEAPERLRAGDIIAARKDRLQWLVDEKLRLTASKMAKSERLRYLLAITTQAELPEGCKSRCGLVQVVVLSQR